MLHMVPIGVGGYNISVLSVREPACQLAADSIGFFRCDFAWHKGLTQMIRNHIILSSVPSCPRNIFALHEQKLSVRCFRMRKTYLKEHKPILYNTLLLSGKLTEHLVGVDAECRERLETLLPQMMRQEGGDEALKARNQMEWVRRMNSIQNRAEEILLNELVYD